MNGDRIVSLTRKSSTGTNPPDVPDAKIILYCPFGFAMDSRMETSSDAFFGLQIRTFMEMEVIRKVVGIIDSKPLVFDTSAGDDCLTAAYLFEAVWKFSHNHRLRAAAVARDTLTPVKVRACEQNDLDKVLPENLMNVSRRARRQTWSDPTDRPINRNILWEAANLLSFSTEETLTEHLEKIQILFSGERNPQAIGYLWHSLLHHHIENGSTLQIRTNAFVQASKQNKGNTHAYKRTNLTTNNAFAKSMCVNAANKIFIAFCKEPKSEANS